MKAVRRFFNAEDAVDAQWAQGHPCACNVRVSSVTGVLEFLRAKRAAFQSWKKEHLRAHARDFLRVLCETTASTASNVAAPLSPEFT